MTNPDRLNVNLGILNQLDTKLRRFTLGAKLELFRKLAHMIDERMGEKSFILNTFTNNVRELYFNEICSNVHLFEIDYLTKVSTAIGEWNGFLKTGFSTREFSTVVNLFKKYCPPFNHMHDEDQKDYSLDLFLTRTAFQQFLYQLHPLIHLYRYNFLFNYQSNTFNVRDLFIKEFGFPYNEFVSFVTALFLLSKNTTSTPLKIEQVVREIGKGKIFTREKVMQLIDSLKMDRATAISKYNEFKSPDERMRVYNYNPYTMKPLLLEDDTLYLPMPQLLFDSITQGFYHMMCYKYRKINFRSDFGKLAFEDYIFHVFDWQSNEYEIIREFEYFIGRDRLNSPDFILVKDNEIVFVEIKATAPKIQLKDADVSTYNEELYKAYAVAVAQCCRKERDYRNGHLTHPKLPQSVGRIYYLVVTLEEFYIMHTDRMRSQVIQYCEQEGFPFSPEQKFHTMGAVTLEQILETDDRNLFGFLRDKEDNGDQLYADAPLTTIQQTDESKKIRAIEFWKNEMNILTKDLFGEDI